MNESNRVHKFCINCGKEMMSDAEVCLRCGAVQTSSAAARYGASYIKPKKSSGFWEFLFGSAGRKIQIISGILFVLNVIAFVILAFTLGIEEVGIYYSTRKVVTPLFWVYLFGGPLVSYVECLLFYGLGELVQNSTDIREELRELRAASVTEAGEK